MKVVGNYFSRYDPKIVTDIYMTNALAGVEGAAYNLTSGRWALAATTEAIDAVCIKASTGGTNVFGTMEIVKPGDILEADCTGAKDAAFLKGLRVGVLDATGLLINVATVSGGHLVVLSHDTVNAKARVLPTQNFGHAH